MTWSLRGDKQNHDKYYQAKYNKTLKNNYNCEHGQCI